MAEAEKHAPCSLCMNIPDHKEVEILHGTDRLPPEVERLRIIGGQGIYGAEQIRACPDCGTYYRFIHDHDSESGVGYGYTDERITRITREQALSELLEIERVTRASIEYWSKENSKGTSHAKVFLTEAGIELERILSELAGLRSHHR